MKLCPACKSVLAADRFYKSSKGDGLAHVCKACHLVLYGRPRIARVKLAERERRLGGETGKAVVCWLEKPCKKCGEVLPLHRFARRAQYFDGHEQRCRKCSRVSAAHASTYGRAYRQRPESKEAHRLKVRLQRQSVPGRLNHTMSRGIWQSLRKAKASKGASWSALVSYTVEQLREHLEARFVEGMGWSNYGRWHIDHIRPLASFSLAGPADKQFTEAWALSNLQPLWARDNIRKGARTA
jgi:hypothetical protein